MNGVNKALHAIDVGNSVGVEIGPLTRPIVRKESGEVFYIDRATTAELKQEFGGSGSHIDPRDIVEVDFVWGEASLADCVGERKFDYCIASHVVEHVPDLITWLYEIADILKPTGVLSLVVPDRRYTFDFLRHNSTLAEAAEAHVQRLRKPSYRQVFDHFFNYSEVDAAQLWASAEYRDQIRPKHCPLEVANAASESLRRYIDAHCWVFTAESFVELLDQIASIKHMPFKIANLFPPERGTNEFFVTLKMSD